MRLNALIAAYRLTAYLEMTVGINEDVSWFDVTVDYFGRMKILETCK